MGDDFIVDGLNELIRQLTRERDEARAWNAAHKEWADVAAALLAKIPEMERERDSAAASERAAIVAMLERRVTYNDKARQWLSLDTQRGYNFRDVLDEELSTLVRLITDLDHHREPGKERGE